MPILTVYSGSINLRASEVINGETFYECSKTVYGKTLGELFDNLVESSVKVAREAERLVAANGLAGYSLGDGYWRASVTLPDIIKCQNKTLPSVLDSTLQSRVFSFEEIVKMTVAYRDVSINQANTYLQLVLPGSSELPEFPTISLSKIGDADTLEVMTEFGWNGDDLERILKTAERENRITAHRAFYKYDDRLAAAGLMSINPLKEGKAKRKKKWWIF